MVKAESIFSSTDAALTRSLLQSLLNALEDSTDRRDAISCLHELAELLENESDKSNASSQSRNLFLKQLTIPGLGEPIRVLLNSAVFSPEFWGQTFAEGILKKTESFAGKSVLELGTGSGWISLLLLRKTSASSVMGLDINPVAVLLANLNKWLNGTRADGSYIWSAAGVPIPLAFTAAVSDLLAVPLERQRKFDRIVGCIPQVLHPVPEKADSSSEDLSYEELYDLSNYCFNQGILEDRFGLPLIARALEESQLCLNPQGQLTFILGGRPGRAAIEEVFKRRGYKPTLIWVRRIQQADDTDLVQLVKLEKSFGIKFHFFTSLTSRQSIPASTAVGLQARGQKIYHDLLVYQAETQFEKPTLDFVGNLHKLKLDGLRKELDFSRASDEQMSFLDRLSRTLIEKRRIPYPHEKGDISLREKLSRFLHVYCHLDVHPNDLFVGPERRQLLSMILKMVSQSSDRILLSSSLEALYGSVLRHQGFDLVLGNDDLDELLSLDSVFQPRISVIAPHQLRQLSPLVLDSLIDHARAHPERWYVIDDSENFDIGSEIQSNMLMRLLGQKQAPPNLVFMYGLIKNTVCPDFELSFLINAPREWVDGLEYCAELSYSRISFLVQLYYQWLFDELLSFPFTQSTSSKISAREISGLSLSEEFRKIARDPIFDPKPIDINHPKSLSPKLIRMDYGECEEDVPDLILKGLVKGFLENRSEDLLQTVRHRVAAYLDFTRNSKCNASSVVLAQGCFPLYGALLQSLRDKLGRKPVVAINNGSYGPIFPLLEYFEAEVEILDLDLESAFVPNVASLEKLDRKPDLLWITQPGNPSGVFMSPQEVSEVKNYCSQKNILILADEIFFLLSDISMGDWTPAEYSFANGWDARTRSGIFVVDGLAKSFAAGGLRCGFMLCPDAFWAEHIGNYVEPVPQAVLRSWDRLYSVFLTSSPHQLFDSEQERQEVQQYLKNMRSKLTRRRNALLKLLETYGLADPFSNRPRGALFILAKIADSAEQLAKEQHLLVNPGGWSRTPSWARLCFSIEEEEFAEALLRLEQFISKHYSRNADACKA